MRFFSTFAVALSMTLLGSALPASAQQVPHGYVAGDGVHCYGGYVSTGDRCVYAGNGGGGYYGGGYPRRARGYYSYDGAHCNYPYVSTGDRCVRAY